MTYTEWRDELKNNLLSVSESERKRVLEYYAEAYADRREAGFSEQEIIKEFGAPYDAAQRILHEDGPSKSERSEPEKSVSDDNQAERVQVGKSESKEKKRSKAVWIVPMCIGIAVAMFSIIFIIGLALNGWMVVPEFETAQYDAVGEITQLNIDNAVGNVKTEFYDGDKIVVEYPFSDQYTMRIVETEDTLTVSGLHKTHRYYFNFFSFAFPETIVKIPRSTILKLDVTVNAGRVELAEGTYAETSVTVNAGSLHVLGMTCPQFKCEVNAGSIAIDSLESASFDCELNAGSVGANRLVCPQIRLEVSAGSAGLKVQGNKEEYSISVDKSAGSCNVKSQTGTDPAKKIDIEVSAGSVSVNFI